MFRLFPTTSMKCCHPSLKTASIVFNSGERTRRRFRTCWRPVAQDGSGIFSFRSMSTAGRASGVRGFARWLLVQQQFPFRACSIATGAHPTLSGSPALKPHCIVSSSRSRQNSRSQTLNRAPRQNVALFHPASLDHELNLTLLLIATDNKWDHTLFRLGQINQDRGHHILPD